MIHTNWLETPEQRLPPEKSEVTLAEALSHIHITIALSVSFDISYPPEMVTLVSYLGKVKDVNEYSGTADEMGVLLSVLEFFMEDGAFFATPLPAFLISLGVSWDKAVLVGEPPREDLFAEKKRAEMLIALALKLREERLASKVAVTDKTAE